MSCQYCRTSLNTGQTFCLYCGSSTASAMHSNAEYGFENANSIQEAGNIQNSIKIQHENANQNLSQNFQDDNESYMNQPLKKVSRGFVYGIIAVSGSILSYIMILILLQPSPYVRSRFFEWAFYIILPVSLIFGILAIVSGNKEKKANKNRTSAAFIIGIISVVLSAILIAYTLLDMM